jgi:hypothetical protein
MLQRWRYITQVIEGLHLQEELDELGEAGWELITVQWEEYSYGGRTQLQARCILKRPAETGEPAPERLYEDFQRAPAGY